MIAIGLSKRLCLSVPVDVADCVKKMDTAISTKSPKRETCLSIGLMLVLAAVAAGIFLAQYRFNPAIIREMPGDPADVAGLATEALIDPPEGILPMTPPQIFGPDNLSDKIDGKAEFYLSAGFLRLSTQRFRPADNDALWLEVFVYEMDSPQNAFSVFSAQRRDDAEPLDLTQYAYRTSNGLYLAHGPYYVEIVASDTTAVLLNPMLSLAQTIVARNPVTVATMAEPDLFPPAGLQPDSIVLIASDAFGFERLKGVYTALYRSGDIEMTAFLSRRDSPEEARSLAAAYRDFLVKFGGQSMDATGLPIAEAAVVEILGSIDVIFSVGTYIGGVHEAPARDVALDLAESLYQRINEVAHGS